MNHIEFAELLRLFESGAGPAGAREHLVECSDCQSTYRRLSEFFSHANAVKSEPVPQAVTARLLNVFQSRPSGSAETARTRSPLLLFDDWTSLVFERHAGIDSRQLLYRVGDYEIDLRLQFVGNKCVVSGQVLPDAGMMAAHLSSEGSAPITASISEFGEFEFPAVERGAYSLTILTNRDPIEIEEVPLHQ